MDVIITSWQTGMRKAGENELNCLIMKYFTGCLLLFVAAAASTPAQTVSFHENFEAPSLGDSVYSSSTSGNYVWTQDPNFLAFDGQHSTWRQVVTGVTVYLNLIPFSTIGFTNIMLHFYHICKVDFLDIATVEVSHDGINWQVLSNQHYCGNGVYAANGNRFACNSYSNLWQPSNPLAIPGNSWWKKECFTLPQLAGLQQAHIRFKLADGGQPGPSGNYGWLIDKIYTTGQYALEGSVTYDNAFATPIDGAQVVLTQGMTTVASTLTDNTGHFQFLNVAPGNYMLLAQSGKAWGGVNATDALGILMHYVGNQNLTGVRYLAADISADGVVNSLDALMAILRFNGMITGFNVGDWIFQHPGFNYTGTTNVIIPVKGLCYGDVNGSYIPPP